jgi:hypothetical protein
VKVTRSDIAKQFDALIGGTRSREDIETWAEARMHAQDLGELMYEPAAAEEQLWRAITFLLGVGLKTSSSDYLHSVEDFEAFRREVEV